MEERERVRRGESKLGSQQLSLSFFFFLLIPDITSGVIPDIKSVDFINPGIKLRDSW